MVKNISENAQFYCINEHEEPVLMKERDRNDDMHDNFFACSKYMRKDERHPDGYDVGEHGCANRLSLADAGDIISKFNQIVEADLNENVICDYTGYTFMHKGIKVRILKYGNGNLKFGILNRKAIG